MPKTLKLWNGRWLDHQADRTAHCYIAAYSKADVVRLVTEVLGYEPRGIMTEINVYWNAGHWGRSMDGITPERGIWITTDTNHTPKRLQKKPSGVPK